MPIDPTARGIKNEMRLDVNTDVSKIDIGILNTLSVSYIINKINKY